MVILSAVLLVLSCITSTGFGANAASSGDDWPMFHYDPAHTGHTNSTGPTSTPVVLWKTETYGPVSSSPAVVDDVVYVSAWFLHAFNASTGSEIWNVSGSGQLLSSIVIGGYIYSGINGSTLYNASTGDKIWSDRWRGYSFYTPIFAVYDDYVYTGYAEPAGDWVMRALNASTGSEIWTYPTKPLSYSPPAISDGHIYFGTETGVCALNAFTGAKLWEYETDSLVESSPAVSGGIVYLGSDDWNIYALNASTGNKIWNYTTGSWVRSSAAVAEGKVFVGSLDRNVYALNALTGAKIWNYTTGYVVDSSPAVAGGVVYVGSGDGNLYAFNASTGAKVWNFTIQPLLDERGSSRYMFASPAVANGTIYMGSTDGIFFALRAPAKNPSSPTPLLDLQLIAVGTVVIIVILTVLLLVYKIKRKGVKPPSRAKHINISTSLRLS